MTARTRRFGAVQIAGIPVDRAEPYTGTDADRVHQALNDRKDVRRRPAPARCRNPASIGRHGDCSHHGRATGLYALIAQWANGLQPLQAITARSCKWYRKDAVTFSDALASMRRQLWVDETFAMSPTQRDPPKVSANLLSVA